MFKNNNSRQGSSANSHSDFLKAIGRITEESLKEAEESLKEAEEVGRECEFDSLVLLFRANPDYVRLVVEQWLDDPRNKDFKVEQNGPKALLFLYGLMRDKKDWHNSFSKALKTIKEDSDTPSVWQYLYIKADLAEKVNVSKLIKWGRNDGIQKIWHFDALYSETTFQWLKSNKEKLWRIDCFGACLRLFYLVDEVERLPLLETFSSKVDAFFKEVFHRIDS